MTPGAWLLLAAAAAAEEPGGTPRRVQEEIVVTAERGPEPRDEVSAAVSILTREEIERLPAKNLAELLQFLPGFQVFFADDFSGTLPMVSARGFFGGGEAEYVQLWVDGVPVGDVESGIADWRAIPGSQIERIEALRGPASFLYGDTALAGIVQVFTRGVSRTGPTGAISLSGGSSGSASGDAAFSAGAGAWGFTARAGASRTGGFRAHSAGEDASGEGSAERRGRRGTWTFRVSGSSRDREDPGALTRERARGDPKDSDPLFRHDRERTDRGRAAATYRGEGTNPFRATVHASSRQGFLLRTLLVAPGIGDRTRRDLTTRTLGLSLAADRSFRLLGGESRLRAGTDIARERIDTDYRRVDDAGALGPRAASASAGRDRTALFWIQDWNPSTRVRLTAGLRFDSIADDFDGAARSPHRAWSPRIGVNVRVGPGNRPPLSLFAVYSGAFKAPTLDQLFDPHPFSDFAGGTFTISNPALTPQRAESFEIGTSRSGGRARFDVLFYRMDVEDEIDFDPATFRYKNIGASRHTGAETSIRISLSETFSAFAAYAWTRAEPRVGENRGRQLKNIAEHDVRAGIGAALPGRLRGQVVVGRQGGRFLDDANQVALENETRLDLRLERRFGHWRAWVDLLNLTDARVEQVGFALADFEGGFAAYVYPARGFGARAGLDWDF